MEHGVPGEPKTKVVAEGGAGQNKWRSEMDS